ncbi:MAG: zinc ribbon domain-containing protein [Bacillota bacterium]|nr:zinc ribbon domain-containing protein [Bacillota bacterium]
MTGNITIYPVCNSPMTTIMIVIGVLILTGSIITFAVVLAARRQLMRLRGILPEALTGRLMQELNAGIINLQNQEPVSLSGMDRIFAPQIQADFPELNLEELKRRTERLAITTLSAIDSQDAGQLSESHELYLAQVKQYLKRLKALGQREQYSEITVHRIVISDYQKREGTCRIRFQLAVGAQYRRTDQAGRQLSGQDTVTQFKLEIEALYVQDKDHPGSLLSSALAVNCPNCGAPVPSLGDRRCAFCGSAIEPINNKVWTFSRFERSPDRQ